MSDDKQPSQEEIDQLRAEVDEAMDSLYFSDLDDPMALIEKIYYLWTQWADFHLIIIDPQIETILPPITIYPEVIVEQTGEREHVYPIQDHGNKLSTSRSKDMYAFGISLCRLHNTIEKMIAILDERLKSGGIDDEMEVQVAFTGHEYAQRKAFEVIINLPGNVVVTNFEPGEWGEKYLDTVKKLADRGYGYPSGAPRDSYKKSYGSDQKGLGSAG